MFLLNLFVLSGLFTHFPLILPTELIQSRGAFKELPVNREAVLSVKLGYWTANTHRVEAQQ